MIRKIGTVFAHISSVIKVLLGLALMVAFVFFLNALLASRSLKTVGQPLLPGFQSLTPPPTSTVGQPDHTTGWKVSSNPSYGYSIKYPSDWVANDITAPKDVQDPLQIVVFRPDVSSADLSIDEIEPNLASVAAITVIREPVKEVVSRIEAYELANARRQLIVVGGVSGVKLEGEIIAWDYRAQQSSTERSVVVVLPLRTNTLVFSFKPEPLVYEADFSDIFEKMLASLTIG